MITNKSVFVLGAGASIPYGFPSGQGLIDKICDFGLVEKKILEEIVKTISIVTNFINDIDKADPDSIDIFLENRPEFHEVGKAAIALVLLPLERTCDLIDKWREHRVNKTKPESGGHWYKSLAKLLQCPFEEFGNNDISIITFNYDRSLEHYLCTTLAKFYGKTEAECAEKLKKINIVHIYGQLGFLPWQGPNNPDFYKIKYEAYGPIDDREKRIMIQYAMKYIKTMSEKIEKDDPDIKIARKLVNEAKNTYILGFGFHPRNIEILGMDKLKPDKMIRGTCMGLTMQQKLDLGKLGPTCLGWDRHKNNPRGLYEMDVYEFLHNTAIE